jgi:hypothetical protein
VFDVSELRGHPLPVSDKVWVVTGYADDAAGSGFLDPGMGIVIKPFTMEALASKIRETIEGPTSTGSTTYPFDH